MENDSRSAEIGETPHVSCHKKRNSSIISGSRLIATRSSYENADSGYITMTPHSADLSAAAYTPVQIGSSAACRLRSGCSSNANSSSLPRRRHHHHRVRTSTEIWHSERASRFRSKFNQWLDASELADCSVSSAAAGVGAISPREIQANNHQRGTTTTTVVNTPNNTANVNAHSNAKRNISSEIGLLKAQLRGGEDRLGVPPTAPASTLQLLSPPPSPAAPSLSFGANEPIDEDVEMKLVIVPQSTPHLNPADKNPGSPTSSRPAPSFSSSIESRAKLSKLVITDLRESDIRPKRLDFNQRPKYVSLRRSRVLPNLAGKINVDFMSVLGEESDHWRVVSKILALLTPKDLCSMSMVSKTWRRICVRDSRANMRRLNYVIIRQNIKENLKLIQAKAKAEGDLLSSPERRYERKGLLVEVQNLLQVPASQNTPTSPPVSPSKVKFHSFIKAGRTLEPSEHLLRCPRCLFACQVKGENMASCSRPGCSMEFCKFCSARHTGPCKTALLATPTKRNKRLIAGSRQSKRNLRRL